MKTHDVRECSAACASRELDYIHGQGLRAHEFRAGAWRCVECGAAHVGAMDVRELRRARTLRYEVGVVEGGAFVLRSRARTKAEALAAARELPEPGCYRKGASGELVSVVQSEAATARNLARTAKLRSEISAKMNAGKARAARARVAEALDDYRKSKRHTGGFGRPTEATPCQTDS